MNKSAMVVGLRLCVVLVASCAGVAAAEVVDGPNVRVKKHADGSQSVFTRSADQTLVVKKTQNAAGNIVLVTKYKMDKLGNPLASEVLDGQKNLLFRVDYAYRKADGLLAMERMWDSRTRRVWAERPNEEMPVQVIHYVDGDGKPIRPLVIRYVKGLTFEQVYGAESTTFDPKLFDKPADKNAKPVAKPSPAPSPAPVPPPAPKPAPQPVPPPKPEPIPPSEPLL